MNFADVSVVIPCHEAADTLGRCLASVASQTLQVKEVLVVDDGSRTPVSLPESLPAAFLSRVNLVALETNCGAAAARNEGVRRSGSKYIAFLDADDVWMPQKVETQYRLMEKNGWFMSGHGYRFLPSRSLGLDDDGHEPRSQLISSANFIFGNPFFTPTIMVRRDGFKLFDESFRRADDYKAWLENHRPFRIFRINRVLAHGFKPPIGHSGLTASVGAMHRSYLAVLRSLREEHKVSVGFYFAACSVEHVKLPLRALKTWSRRWRAT